jgi:hypothetical protein
MSEIACILFHSRKRLKKEFYAVDNITQRPYHKYKCEICNRKYLANNKFDWFRLKYRKKIKKLKLSPIYGSIKKKKK